MKKSTDESVNDKLVDSNVKKMTRLEAIRKSGYLAVTAATTMILLSNPLNAHAGSPSPPPNP
jgi:hypothetical protein